MPTQAYTVPGSYTFTVPAFVRTLKQLVALGSGGSGFENPASGSTAGGPGGGSGSPSATDNVAVNPGDTLDIVVNGSPAANSDGSDCTISYMGSIVCSGLGGKTSADGTAVGLGGGPGVGTTTSTGGNGGAGDPAGGGGGGGGNMVPIAPGDNGSDGAGTLGGAGGGPGDFGGAGGDLGSNGVSAPNFGGGGGGAGGDVAVKNAPGLGGPGAATISWDDPPVLSNCSPLFGSTLGGDVVDVYGTGFVSGATVDFGGSSVASTFISSTHLRVTTPSHSSGAVTVTVKNPNNNFGPRTSAFNFVQPSNGLAGPFIDRRKRRF